MFSCTAETLPSHEQHHIVATSRSWGNLPAIGSTGIAALP